MSSIVQNGKLYAQINQFDIEDTVRLLQPAFPKIYAKVELFVVLVQPAPKFCITESLLFSQS